MSRMPAILTCRWARSRRCTHKRSSSTRQGSTSVCARPSSTRTTRRTRGSERAQADRRSARTELPGDQLGDGERGREPGALDAVEAHHSFAAVRFAPVNSKVGDRFARAVELWAHPGVVGVQAIDLKARIVAADEIEKLVELLRP